MHMCICMWKFQKSGNTKIMEIPNFENIYLCRQTCIMYVNVHACLYI